MITRKIKFVFSEWRFAKRFVIVPFGAIFLFVCMVGWGNPEANPGPKEKKRRQISQQGEKKDQKIEEIRKYLGKLTEINEKRAELQTEQDKLLDRVTLLKDKNQTKTMGPDKILTRRELEKNAGKLHKILEEDRKMARNQQTIVQKLLQNREETFALIKAEKKTLERQISRMEKESDAPSEKRENLQKRLN